MREAPHEVPSLSAHPDYRAAVPITDHFLPLLYVAGMAAAAQRPASTLVEGYSYGALSMTAYALEARCPDATTGGGGAAPLATSLPPDAANV
ncbi:MAG: 4,5-DOPA dioxygenase extradiol, partial [Xanthomonadaceae bacterium]|nr:4,5-DOPA dioxygenase extradiol [Xanthomonadaceae bacterium]